MKKRKALTKKVLPHWAGPVVLIAAVACVGDPAPKPKKKNRDDMPIHGSPSNANLLTRVMDLLDLWRSGHRAEASLQESEQLSYVTVVFKNVPEGTHSVRTRSNPNQDVPIEGSVANGIRVTLVVPHDKVVQPELVFYDANGNELAVFHGHLRTETFVSTYEVEYISTSLTTLRDHGDILFLEPQEAVSINLTDRQWLMGEQFLTRRIHFATTEGGTYNIETTSPLVVYQQNRLFPLEGTGSLSLSGDEEVGLYPHPQAASSPHSQTTFIRVVKDLP